MLDFSHITVFVICGAVALLVIRPIVIKENIMRYIKKHHRAYWEENIHLFVGRTGFSGVPMSQLINDLHDPKFKEYKRQWDAAIKQLILVFLIFTVGFGILVILILFEAV